MSQEAITPSSKGAKLSGTTFLESKNYRFLIMDAPTDANLSNYIEVLAKRKVRYVVRACDPSYSTAPLAKAGINVVDLPFPDGDPPPEDIVNRWLKLVEQEFIENGDEKSSIAVHCVAGLGRAPVLVAIALVAAGMDPYDAINFIRKKRRGAINARQLKYIERYKRRSTSKSCSIM